MHLLFVENCLLHVPLVRVMLQKTLPPPVIVEEARSLAEARRWLKHPDIDVILLSLDLPESSGLDTLYTLQPLAGDIPIVALSRNDDPAVALAAVQYGASDFLVAERLDGARLAEALSFAVARSAHLRQLRCELRSRRSAAPGTARIENY